MVVLLVDDNADFLRLIERHVTAAGHEVVRCGGGHGLKELITETRPDLVAVDLRMPGFDGAELARAIASRPFPKRPMVVLWSSVDDTTLAQAGRRAGVPTISKLRGPAQVCTDLLRMWSQKKAG
jgi:CheY-like chemotaxis protein